MFLFASTTVIEHAWPVQADSALETNYQLHHIVLSGTPVQVLVLASVGTVFDFFCFFVSTTGIDPAWPVQADSALETNYQLHHIDIWTV
jgi:hypothetical protein